MKTLDLEKLVRPNILKLSPYRCARDDFESGVLLDANENSFGSLIDSELELNRYPDPYQNRLRDKVAAFRGVKRDQVFLGSGSDEAIDLLIRAFCEPKEDAVIITPPTYGMYKVSAEINNNEVISVPLTPDFRLEPAKVLERAGRQSVKIIFLCSPNNPTGNSLDEEDMIRLIENFGGLVVVDEAYIDFSRHPSLAARIRQYPNLVILQTFSKAFGLAGVRLGTAMADEDVIRVLMKIKAPYNLNKLTAQAGLQAFEQSGQFREVVEKILTERDRLIAEFDKLPFIEKVFPTDANFMLVKIKNAREIYRKLAYQGIIVRYRGDQIHCGETLRITVGTPAENDLLLQIIQKVVS